MSKKPVVLMVLDGYGLNDRTEGNAIAMANTPVMDKLMKECPFQKGYASGLAVGLPDGQMGNSEVGHMNIGAGRIIYQDLTRITKDIEDGTFFKNEELLEAMENCKKNDSDLHLFGLLSDGGVHSHLSHVYGLLEMAKQQGVSKVYVHAFLDGRDTPPASAKGFVETLENKMAEIGVGKVASLSGRYYAMDRDNRWDRVELAYKALTKGEGVEGTDAAEAVQASYDAEKTDEFVLPTVLKKDGKPVVDTNFNKEVILTKKDAQTSDIWEKVLTGAEYTAYHVGTDGKKYYYTYHVSEMKVDGYTTEITYKGDRQYSITVTNTKNWFDSLLPETGGMGKALLYTLGVLLLCLVTATEYRKRKSTRSQSSYK